MPSDLGVIAAVQFDRSARRLLYYAVIAVVAIMITSGASVPNSTRPKWVGHDPVDHYFQVLDLDFYRVIWREVGVRQVPDGNGGVRTEPIANAFVPGSKRQVMPFFYDGSNSPYLTMPDGTRCRLRR
jgi:hypothetical protein